MNAGRAGRISENVALLLTLISDAESRRALLHRLRHSVITALLSRSVRRPDLKPLPGYHDPEARPIKPRCRPDFPGG